MGFRVHAEHLFLHQEPGNPQVRGRYALHVEKRPRRDKVLLENRHPAFLPKYWPWNIETDCPPENQGFAVALATWRNHWFGGIWCSNWQLLVTILCELVLDIFRPLVERRKGREVLFQICRWHCDSIGQQGMVAQSSCRYAKVSSRQLEVESQEELASVPGRFTGNWFSWLCVFPHTYKVAQGNKTTSLPPGGIVEQKKGLANQNAVQAGNRILVGLVQVLWFNKLNFKNSKDFALWD